MKKNYFSVCISLSETLRLLKTLFIIASCPPAQGQSGSANASASRPHQRKRLKSTDSAHGVIDTASSFGGWGWSCKRWSDPKHARRVLEALEGVDRGIPLGSGLLGGLQLDLVVIVEALDVAEARSLAGLIFAGALDGVAPDPLLTDDELRSRGPIFGLDGGEIRELRGGLDQRHWLLENLVLRGRLILLLLLLFFCGVFFSFLLLIGVRDVGLGLIQQLVELLAALQEVPGHVVQVLVRLVLTGVEVVVVEGLPLGLEGPEVRQDGPARLDVALGQLAAEALVLDVVNDRLLDELLAVLRQLAGEPSRDGLLLVLFVLHFKSVNNNLVVTHLNILNLLTNFQNYK